MKKFPILSFAFVMIGAATLLTGCTPGRWVRQNTPFSRKNEQAIAPASSPTIAASSVTPAAATPSPTPATVIELIAKTVNAKETALDLLKNSGAKVETKSYGKMGSFIIAINGMASDATHYWAFYLNDHYAQQAADRTVLKPGDRIKFAYENVSDAKVK